MKSLFIALIKIYKAAVSPYLPQSCRFHPTCSEYTIQALKKYGAVKGLWLGFLRILRCNPFNKGGFDPLK
ncbi:MAG: membrane protein insertion efficiency factor YidD [Spirochaetia bacterium]|nr:membrane protein insertion efficiency factor YidD [Spirochaetia bacterium]